MTVLRHPVERTLSFLRHQAERRQRGATEDTPLEEIYDDPFRFEAMIQNHMTRMLSLTPDEMVAGDGVLTTVPYTRRAARHGQGVPRRARPLRRSRSASTSSAASCSDRYGLDVGGPLGPTPPRPARAGRASPIGSPRTTRSTWSSTISRSASTRSATHEHDHRADDAGAPTPLAAADALVGGGPALEAIELLQDATASGPDDDAVEIRLAELRHAAFAELAEDAASTDWPVAGRRASTAAARRSSRRSPRRADRRRGRAAQHPEPGQPAGAGLFREYTARFVDGIERARVRAAPPRPPVQDQLLVAQPALARARGNSPRSATGSPGAAASWPATRPHARHALRDLRPRWACGTSSPSYLGERPVLSANKCTLRRVPLDANTDWHQDGAFLGSRDPRPQRLDRAHRLRGRLARDGPRPPPLRRRAWRPAPAARSSTGRSDPTPWRPSRPKRPPVRPEFKAGDALLFDDLYLHRTAVDPSMARPRYAIESWFFAPTDYPEGQVPLVW